MCSKLRNFEKILLNKLGPESPSFLGRVTCSHLHVGTKNKADLMKVESRMMVTRG